MYNHEFDAMMSAEVPDVELMKKELLRRGEAITRLQDKLRPYEYNKITLDSKGYLYFGVANGWSDSPARDYIMNKCDHKPQRECNNNRGFDGVTKCDECKFYYTSDSSD